ncbi:hypothetical protein B0H34DRAFT_712592 [Crassisporium funariophilum]|nr:hypothetical protein B0H34DRAFT_712592 [Crassisporium funariophilum]
MAGCVPIMFRWCLCSIIGPSLLSSSFLRLSNIRQVGRVNSPMFEYKNLSAFLSDLKSNELADFQNHAVPQSPYHSRPCLCRRRFCRTSFRQHRHFG